MWNVSIFLSEGLYYSYICLLIFQGDRQNCISRTEERISPTILLFFRKRTSKVSKNKLASRYKD